MQNDVNKQEYLSALVDGELSEAELSEALQLTSSPTGQKTWQLYQCIGESLRSSAVASLPAAATAPAENQLLIRLREQIAQEPHARPQLAAAEPVRADAMRGKTAANDAVFRWKLLAGGASFAAVLAVSWALALSPGVLPDAALPVQMAASGASSSHTSMGLLGQPLAARGEQETQTAALAPVGAASGETQQGAAVMLRDPRLDELLAAQRQYGNSAALQLPASFLRNANFAAPKR